MARMSRVFIVDRLELRRVEPFDAIVDHCGTFRIVRRLGQEDLVFPVVTIGPPNGKVDDRVCLPMVRQFESGPHDLFAERWVIESASGMAVWNVDKDRT